KRNSILPPEFGSREEGMAFSPDHNPIDHFTLADLRQMLVEEWDATPQQCVTRLVTSTRRRCQAVLAVDILFHHCNYTGHCRDISMVC
uniref:Uncharacterized protein n=1 Tax=Labrus bergylta TaxID=56723 RepID=A0A3Q3H363_9LABR